MKLHASGEDYLEAVLVLQKEKGMVRSVDVARHMEVSKPSVCHAVTTLKKGGFLTMDEDFSLHLTDSRHRRCPRRTGFDPPPAWNRAAPPSPAPPG